MNFDKIQERLSRLPDVASLRQIASGLGHELLRARPDILKRFRRMCAQTCRTSTDSYTKGYLGSLGDVAAAFEAAAEDARDHANLVFALEMRRLTESLLAFQETAVLDLNGFAAKTQMEHEDAIEHLRYLNTLGLIEPCSSETPNPAWETSRFTATAHGHHALLLAKDWREKMRTP